MFASSLRDFKTHENGVAVALAGFVFIIMTARARKSLRFWILRRAQGNAKFAVSSEGVLDKPKREDLPLLSEVKCIKDKYQISGEEEGCEQLSQNKYGQNRHDEHDTHELGLSDFTRRISSLTVDLDKRDLAQRTCLSPEPSSRGPSEPEFTQRTCSLLTTVEVSIPEFAKRTCSLPKTL